MSSTLSRNRPQAWREAGGRQKKCGLRRIRSVFVTVEIFAGVIVVIVVEVVVIVI
jgi:hypothetical protein